MPGLLAKLFKKAPPDGKKAKPGNGLKRIGILSVLLWMAAIGAVFAVKGMDLTPANTHDKAGHAEEDEEEAALADVPASAHEESAGEETAQEEASHGDTSHGESGHAEAQGDAEHGAAEHAGAAPGEAAPKAETHASGKGHQKASGREAAHEETESEGGGKPQAESEAVSVVGPASEDERNALRELAEIHASRGDLQKAVAPLRKLLAAPTKDVALLSLAAEVFHGTGNYREALAAARKALRHAAPGRVDLEAIAILSQYRLGDVDAAFKSAEAALRNHPRDVDLLTALGTMEIERGPGHPHFGESLAKALKIKPGHVPALYQLGRKAQLLGDYKDAELRFRQVLKKEPKHAKAHGQLGAALYHLRKEEPARKEFLLALSLNPRDYNTWFNLGELCLSRAAQAKSPGKIREWRAQAMASYLKAVEWNPAHAEAHFRIGVILNGNGQFKEAIRHLEASRKVDDHHAPTWVQMAVAYESLKKPQRAKACLEKALELDPGDKIVQFKLRQMI